MAQLEDSYAKEKEEKKKVTKSLYKPLTFIGTEHYQIYIELPKDQRLSYMRRIEGAAHWEPCKDIQAAQDYCSKADTRVSGPYTGGQITGKISQGRRTDLLRLRDSVKQGTPLRQICDDDTIAPTMLRYPRAYNLLQQAYTVDRNWDCTITLVFGPTGTGKTTWAHTEYPDIFTRMPGKWWDGYNGERKVLLDDFKGWIPFNELLRIADRWPYRAEIKGGSTSILCDELIITTNYPPRRWYNDTESKYWPAFWRRVGRILYLDKLGSIIELPKEPTDQLEIKLEEEYKRFAGVQIQQEEHVTADNY
jgi:hypothetical protein